MTIVRQKFGSPASSFSCSARCSRLRSPQVGHRQSAAITRRWARSGAVPSRVGKSPTWGGRPPGAMAVCTANLTWKPTPIQRRRSFILAGPTSESRFDEANHRHLLEAAALGGRRSMDRSSPRPLGYKTQPPKTERGTSHVIEIDERQQVPLEIPTAASTLNLRVQPLQFCSGVVDFELPVHAALFGVGLLGPDPDL